MIKNFFVKTGCKDNFWNFLLKHKDCFYPRFGKQANFTVNFPLFTKRPSSGIFTHCAPMLKNVFRVRARVGLGLGLGFGLELGLDMVYPINFELAKTLGVHM
eukprot:sb/3478334/